MQSDLIFSLIAFRAKELGQSQYVPVYEQIPIPAGETVSVSAYNNLYFLVDSPKSVQIVSDLGQYNMGGRNEHEHKGYIKITSIDTSEVWITFIKVIFQA